MRARACNFEPYTRQTRSCRWLDRREATAEFRTLRFIPNRSNRLRGIEGIGPHRGAALQRRSAIFADCNCKIGKNRDASHSLGRPGGHSLGRAHPVLRMHSLPGNREVTESSGARRTYGALGRTREQNRHRSMGLSVPVENQPTDQPACLSSLSRTSTTGRTSEGLSDRG
jgi:hypothetical protein